VAEVENFWQFGVHGGLRGEAKWREESGEKKGLDFVARNRDISEDR
jgi:hypothetical protein